MARTKTNTRDETKTLTTSWRNRHLENIYFCVFRWTQLNRTVCFLAVQWLLEHVDCFFIAQKECRMWVTWFQYLAKGWRLEGWSKSSCLVCFGHISSIIMLKINRERSERRKKWEKTAFGAPGSASGSGLESIACVCENFCFLNTSCSALLGLSFLERRLFHRLSCDVDGCTPSFFFSVMSTRAYRSAAMWWHVSPSL